MIPRAFYKRILEEHLPEGQIGAGALSGAKSV
jgi:hypothetical protein